MPNTNPNTQALAGQALSQRVSRTLPEFKQALVSHLYFSRGQGAHTASPEDVYAALVLTVRDYLMDRFRRTSELYYQQRPKFVYYLSAEYLPGKQITQNLLYAGVEELACQALADYGLDLNEMIRLEPEPALGNGGLGRLAACYMDAMATLGIPAVSYGIHYQYGIFKQLFKDGWQVERPDEWLINGNAWEFPQSNHTMEVGFGGATQRQPVAGGDFRVRWFPAEKVLGEPSHFLVPGYGGGVVNLLRLWQARASMEFDFQLFDVGDYARAAEQKISSENITKVLYPNDNTPQGKELRLRQEYFFVSCSLQDILRRFRAFDSDWAEFPKRVVIQLNDTHPVLAIPELMRLLMDDHGLGWDAAWAITTQVFAYTCHTLMPEALEKWPVSLFELLLPRHLEIIYEINQRFLAAVRARFPGDVARVRRMSLIEDAPERLVRMAYLATVGSFSVNGVAELHSELLRTRVLADFSELWPEKFNNKTNGVSPRRFMRIANPALAGLIERQVGPGWENDLERLRGLEAAAADPGFRAEWAAVKRANKVNLGRYIEETLGVAVDPDSMYDVMVKRLHEYKRQLLKALHILTLYNRLKANPGLDVPARTFIFGAKAAPGYHQAKLIIKLINAIGEVVNHDPSLNGKLKVAFLPNFNVTLGERIYPAADLSEQISLAGKEASGTGNMKFALNGAVTIGTLDGANIEIRERVGAENFFLFGLTTEEVFELRRRGYRAGDYADRHPELRPAIELLGRPEFTNGAPDLFRPIVDTLLYQDEYLLLADYAAYIACQDQVERVYRDRDAWLKMSILNTARCGFFSADRAVAEYAADIWGVKPIRSAAD
jgi:starch phosphorylase